MISHYKQGWYIDEQFAMFAMHLKREHTTLIKDNITISDVDKKQHLIVKKWACGCFDCSAMSEWNGKSTDEKTYVNMVVYFTKQLRHIQHFEVIG